MGSGERTSRDAAWKATHLVAHNLKARIKAWRFHVNFWLCSHTLHNFVPIGLIWEQCRRCGLRRGR